jgi:hypothetical protein
MPVPQNLFRVICFFVPVTYGLIAGTAIQLLVCLPRPHVPMMRPKLSSKPPVTPITANYFPQQQGFAFAPPALSMPMRGQMFNPGNLMIGPDVPPLPSPPPKEEEGELTPRGKNRRPRKWSCTPIVAWIGMFLAFFALVMVAIVYFKISASAIELRQEIAGRLVFPAVAAAEELSPRSKHVLDAMRHLGHNHTHYVKFQLNGVAGQFARWPAVGVIQGLEFKRLANMRVCCHLSDQYFVCDSGQGATQNIGLECIVRHVAADQGTHLLIYVQSAQMNGAQCTFMWQTRDPDDPLLGDVSEKDDKAITNEIVANQKEI